jgi:hypothetical protein
LPYSTDLHKAFGSIIPAEKFVPEQERSSFTGKPMKALLQIPSRSQPFKNLLEKMSRKLH